MEQIKGYFNGDYPFLESKFIKKSQFSGKKVLLRCDYNVPFFDNGEISDTSRIDKTLETINYLLSSDASIIICSHLGRPHGQVIPALSLKPISDYLSSIINRKVKFTGQIFGATTSETIASLEPGGVCMLENLRFDIGEETCNDNFSQKLAELSDVYVNDAFGTCHREHASLVGVTKYLPSFYGCLIKHEISTMSKILKSPKRPFVTAIGGSKVSDKFGIIKSFINITDVLIIGGGMAYTFMNALGYSVGDSICEKDKIEMAKTILTEAKEKNVKLLLPIDNKIGKEYAPDTECKVVDADKIPDGWQGLDIGPKTEKLYTEEIKNAKTFIWNGPMGVSEWKNFSSGTFEVARAAASPNIVSIVGGGDSAAAVKKLSLVDKMSHVSTGGGASLMFFEGKELPGVAAIMS
ncbi:MAG: phosphoglycerate kinase [Candidatus Improbicoccus devescovinae]|nr:MAG: phosphoglycerate kinase [Candidatus Improbicoccus devescovinae]